MLDSQFHNCTAILCWHTAGICLKWPQQQPEYVGIYIQRISESTVSGCHWKHDLNAHMAYSGNILTRERHQTHVNWCTCDHRCTHRQWQSVLFTDELQFFIDMHDGFQKVWWQPCEHYSNFCIRESLCCGRGIAMVWAGISWRHRTRLVVIDGDLMACRYIDVLETTLIPFLQYLDDVSIFQQNNAWPHAVRLTKEFIHQNNVNMLLWPAFSLDLSWIEHRWQTSYQ